MVHRVLPHRMLARGICIKGWVSEDSVIAAWAVALPVEYRITSARDRFCTAPYGTHPRRDVVIGIECRSLRPCSLSNAPQSDCFVPVVLYLSSLDGAGLWPRSPAMAAPCSLGVWESLNYMSGKRIGGTGDVGRRQAHLRR
jgi:hypothetical protein